MVTPKSKNESPLQVKKSVHFYMVHGIQNDQNVVAFPLCDFKNEDDLKNEDDPKNEYDLKDEDDLKNKTT